MVPVQPKGKHFASFISMFPAVDTRANRRNAQASTVVGQYGLRKAAYGVIWATK